MIVSLLGCPILLDAVFMCVNRSPRTDLHKTLGMYTVRPGLLHGLYFSTSGRNLKTEVG